MKVGPPVYCEKCKVFHLEPCTKYETCPDIWPPGVRLVVADAKACAEEAERWAKVAEMADRKKRPAIVGAAEVACHADGSLDAAAMQLVLVLADFL